MIIGLSITILVLVIAWLASKVWFLEKDLEDMSECLENYKTNIVGRKKEKLNAYGMPYIFSDLTTTTIIDDIKELEKSCDVLNSEFGKRFARLEEYLGVKRVIDNKVVDKYVKVKKTR